jgi:hypothetical protein
MLGFASYGRFTTSVRQSSRQAVRTEHKEQFACILERHGRIQILDKYCGVQTITVRIGGDHEKAALVHVIPAALLLRLVVNETNCVGDWL